MNSWKLIKQELEVMKLRWALFYIIIGTSVFYLLLVAALLLIS